MGPLPWHLLVRGTYAAGFEVIEVGSGKQLAERLPSVSVAMEIARAHHNAPLWQQYLDDGGRPRGQLRRLM